MSKAARIYTTLLGLDRYVQFIVRYILSKQLKDWQIWFNFGVTIFTTYHFYKRLHTKLSNLARLDRFYNLE